MKCSHCGHDVSEKAAKFCSECGHKLSVQPPNNQDTRDQPKSLVSESEGTTGKSVSQTNAPSVESKESDRSPKRPNDESISNPKKKKKKKKKNKKKKDGTLLLDIDQSQSELSQISIEDDQGQKTKGGGETSDSENSDNAMDEKPDSLQDESQPSSLAVNAPTAATVKVKNSEDTPGNPDEPETNAPKSTQDQTLKTAPTDTPTQQPISEDSKSTAPQSGSDKGTKAANLNPKDQKTDRKNSKKEKDMTKQPALDQNANVQPNTKQTGQTKQKGKNQQDPKQKSSPVAEQQMVFGSQTQSKTGQTKQKEKNQQDLKQKSSPVAEPQMVFGSQTQSKPQSAGSSVDPKGTVEPMAVQQSGSGQDSDADKGSKDDSKDEKESSNAAVPPPERLTRNQTIATRDRLTIYFHAVLSKDFKFNPNEDHIFIRAGSPIGKWEENTVELFVTRDLGDHGFLVEGTLLTTKSKAVSESIPYKYVVYKKKMKDYEFEFIYKLDSTHITNRCLFVKQHLLNENGEWHQYDDIICTQPSKNRLKRFTEAIKEKLWPEERNNLIRGREIAGNIMLETIFDLLRSWDDVNLRSFQIQLTQFFHVYGEPFVYEERQKRWFSLNYGEDEVKMMLKEFMLKKVIPQMLQDGEGKSLYIKDPMRAAVIMLYVWRKYHIRLDHGELNRLCTALILPKQDKDNFLQYWKEFSQDVATLKNLPDMLVFLINAVKTAGMPRWILVLPLLHLLKGTSKPFEAPTSGNLKYGSTWAGLQGLDFGYTTYMSSQDKKALVNALKNRSHLMEVDALLVRSCLYLMSFDDLMECVININTELYDMLLVFTDKVPQDITGSNFETVSHILSHIQGHLIEEKYSHFTEAYRRGCLATAVKLLEKLCKGVKPNSYTQNYPDIPVACMNLVASVSDFVHCHKQQESQEGETQQQYAKDLTSQALVIMRHWISRSFRQGLLIKGLTTWYKVKATVEMETWNNIISIQFKDEDCTKEWRQTFTMDFEGKYQKGGNRSTWRKPTQPWG